MERLPAPMQRGPRVCRHGAGSRPCVRQLCVVLHRGHSFHGTSFGSFKGKTASNLTVPPGPQLPPFSLFLPHSYITFNKLEDENSLLLKEDEMKIC